MRKVAVQTFRRLWQQLLSSVVTVRPATYLCWYCQKGVTKLARSANLPDAEKTAAVRDYEEHLRRATSERTHYTDVCKSVKENTPPNFTLGPHASCSYAGKSHYNFDFAQQVHFPSDPLQPGPIYFKCPHKFYLRTNGAPLTNSAAFDVLDELQLTRVTPGPLFGTVFAFGLIGNSLSFAVLHKYSSGNVEGSSGTNCVCCLVVFVVVPGNNTQTVSPTMLELTNICE
ncbi:hypothetical protein LSAT2_009142 [Lamellibrachia satsuma]|nr:hypothetical protein LSAT2_009142 [Lamellibrachia satsuma]